MDAEVGGEGRVEEKGERWLVEDRGWMCWLVRSLRSWRGTHRTALRIRRYISNFSPSASTKTEAANRVFATVKMLIPKADRKSGDLTI